MFKEISSFSKAKALEILYLEGMIIRSTSDYYKAVSSLKEFPCDETENALLNLLNLDSDIFELNIAKRKAIRVLAHIKCKRAIPAIADYLTCSDPYLIENSLWALNEMNCKDNKIQKKIIDLLDNKFINKRSVIQVIGYMNLTQCSDKLNYILNKSNLDEGEIGACIAAICRLNKTQFRYSKLKNLLYSRNQNNRHMAIQNIIDADAVDLLNDVINFLAKTNPRNFRNLSFV